MYETDIVRDNNIIVVEVSQFLSTFQWNKPLSGLFVAYKIYIRICIFHKQFYLELNK